jgi:hypothetical protein
VSTPAAISSPPVLVSSTKSVRRHPAAAERTTVPDGFAQSACCRARYTVALDTPKVRTLHLVDLVYNPDGGRRPEVLITDQGSYSDIVFAIVTLLGFDYRPVLADLPDTRLWRIDRSADYGRLDRAARGTIDLEAVRRH